MERKGICKNVGVCSKANKIQVITDDDAEFKCPECGMELEEVKPTPPPPPTPKWPKILAAVVGVAVVGGGIFYFASGSNAGGDEVPVVTVDTQKVRVDTLAQEPADTPVINTPEPVKEPEKVDPPASPQPKNSVNLGYAKFVGPVKGGKPNGTGRMTFSSSHVIDSRDVKGRVAESGDYVLGEWKDGKLVQGRWFGSDGNVKGTLMIGM